MPEPIVTKNSVGDYIEDLYSCAKFHHDSITSFCPRVCKTRVKWLG